jgi:hypothetical protein
MDYIELYIAEKEAAVGIPTHICCQQPSPLDVTVVLL